MAFNRDPCPGIWKFEFKLELDLPIFGNVERPLEQEMGVVVVVEELGHGIVVSAGQHAGGGFFGVDCERGRISNLLSREGREGQRLTFLLVCRLAGGTGGKASLHMGLMTDQPLPHQANLPASPRLC